MNSMMKKVFILIFFIKCVLGQEPEVEIDDIFGNVLFQQGIPQSVTCLVWNPLLRGQVSWKIGDKIIENDNRVTTGDEGQLVQVLNFTPTLEDDGKNLECQYIDGSEEAQVYTDHVGLNIYVMDLPEDTITPEMVEEGDSLRLVVTAGLFPAPKSEHILWEVKKPDGTIEAELYPGENDEYGLYSAGNIEEVSANQYQFHLDLAVLDESEVSNSHSVTIQTKGIKKTINFNLSMKKKQEREEMQDENKGSEKSVVPGEDAASKETNPEPDSLGLGMGLFIIIGIIALFIILCIIYCIYRRRKKTRSKDSKTYTAVRTTPSTVGQQV